MNKNIIIPIVVLLLLFLVWIFQWQTIARETLRIRMVEWQRNIITGEQRSKEYYPDKIKITQLRQEEDYTVIYYALLSGTTIALIWQLIKNKKALK